MPDIGDLVTVRIVQAISGEPIINNLSFDAVAPFGTWQELCSQMGTELEAALGVVGGAGVWYTERSQYWTTTGVQIIDVSPGVAAMNQQTTSGAGTDTGESLPPNDALCMTLRSDFKGQSGRGRIYLAGYGEVYQQQGYWLGTAQDSASAIGSALMDGFGPDAGGASFRWCVLHQMSGGSRLVPPEVKPITSFTIHNEVRSIGRRAVGRRIHRTRTGA